MNVPAASSPASRLTDAAARVALRLGGGGSQVSGLGDEELLELLADATEARKALELIVAGASAEVSRRSSRDLGYDGLAQRKGLRTGTALVQHITGLGRTDVTRAVEAGNELAPVVTDSVGDVQSATAPAVPVVDEWLGALRSALASGRLTQAQFQAIRAGLGEPPVARYPELAPDFLPEPGRAPFRCCSRKPRRCRSKTFAAKHVSHEIDSIRSG
ncbi:hypothetical protein ACWKWN_05970 [Microbacterium trichothecenolyticum]